MKQILFIIGSLRKKSFNRQLAKVAENMIKDRFDISYLDFDDIPYMNQDLELLMVKSQKPMVNTPDIHYAENGELEAGSHRLSDCHTSISHDDITAINRIRQITKQCDAIWIFTPEYNHSYPGLLKNLFDWLSRPEDVSDFTEPTVVQSKKVTASGAGGKNKTRSCREKLNELLEYIKMDVMKEPQTGIELGIEAWTKGVFHLTEEQMEQLREQAEKFAEFVEKEE